MKKNLTKKNYKFKKQSIKVNDIVQIICGNDKTKQVWTAFIHKR